MPSCLHCATRCEEYSAHHHGKSSHCQVLPRPHGPWRRHQPLQHAGRGSLCFPLRIAVRKTVLVEHQHPSAPSPSRLCTTRTSWLHMQPSTGEWRSSVTSWRFLPKWASLPLWICHVFSAPDGLSHTFPLCPFLFTSPSTRCATSATHLVAACRRTLTLSWCCSSCSRGTLLLSRCSKRCKSTSVALLTKRDAQTVTVTLTPGGF